MAGKNLTFRNWTNSRWRKILFSFNWRIWVVFHHTRVISFNWLVFDNFQFWVTCPFSKWGFRLHRCWWQKSETKCVGDNFVMLVTNLIHCKITNIKRHQYEAVTNIAVARITNAHYESIFIQFSNFFPQKMTDLQQKYFNKINNSAIG